MYIAWPSHNRVESLLRSIKSFHKDLPSLKFVIANSGEQLVGDLLKENEIDALVIEGKGRESWEECLGSECLKLNIPIEIINFLLGKGLKVSSNVITTGANRNLLLLKLAGKKFLTVDDDVVLEVRKFILQNNSHLISESITNPWSCLHFKNKDELLNFKNKMPLVKKEDLINDHASALSYTQEEKRCGVSLSGYFGDSGFQGSGNIFYLHENGINDLLKDEKTLSYALESRIIWRSTSQNNMRETSSVMLMCAGLANDLELPPFFPYGRNQDGAFGFALKGCLNSVFIGHLNLSIFHDPLNARNYQHDFSPLQIRINDLLVLIWVELIKKKEEKNYEKASLYFLDFAKNEGFKERLSVIVSNHFKERAQNIQKRMDKFPNSTWTVLAEKEKEACLNSSVAISYLIPEEAKKESMNEEEAIELTRHWLCLYAELLVHWTKIREVAQSI